MPQETTDAELAAELVRAAGALAQRMRRGGLSAEQKTSVSDIVTAADRDAEALVVSRLRRLRPDDAIVGEEGANHAGTSGRSWVIDPVDGTYNFLAGSTYWCSAIALKDESGVILGAIYHPHDDLLWFGGPGMPTLRNGELLPAVADLPLSQLSAATYLHPALITEPDVAAPFMQAARRPATLRMFGSGSMDLAGVAEGRNGCWFQHSCPEWDWLPGKAIVEGVGGSTAQVEVNGRIWSIAGGSSAVRELSEALSG
ncbi:inositol monophosphatase family protein [Saxibacter everestensis]|uniref:Inositol monophosphatase family protein n=1 Tax=Saxibacter everestensis TaxID=2909229 RepID=A0ABY8QXP8_9MICO|nr:inositol monophosphatase family protein [Brevibacteriaceae bacterium ZFBP1038]